MSEAPVAVRPSRGLGSAQQVVWTGQRAAPDVPLANMATLTHFDRPVDAERLADAFARVVESSDALRTVVHERQGVPVPTVCAAPPGSTEVIELGPGELADWVVERVGVPLDLATCGYDSVLLRLADGQIAWYLCLHHVITDATSSSLVYRATAAAYEGRPFTTGSYREHLRGLEYRRQSRPWRRAAEHWAADEPEPADPLALFGPRRPATTRNHRTPVEVGAERRAGLERLLAGELASFSPDLTRLAFVATCLAVQLHRVAGLSTMRIGIPIHHRGTDDERDLVGLLMELYPITVAVGADDTFRDVYDRALRSAITTLRRAEPGAGPRQDFEVVLNLVPAAFGPFGTIGARTEWVHSGHVDAEHRLRCQVYDFTGDGRLRIDLDISEALADVDERQRMVRHFGAVLDAFLADPDASVGSFPVVDEAERAVVVEAFNDVAPLEAPAATDVVPALRARGSEPAVSYGAVVRSGDQLADDIDALAVWLHEQGIGPGDRVGIEMRRSIDAVVAIHGVLRVGAAFCPIDPELPAMRRAMLIEDLEPALVLDGLPELAAGRTFEHPPTGPDALAYVLFTSGSTGRPKGVPITHRGLSHYLGFALEAYVGDTPPVVALHSSLSFDLTITSLFLPLLAGGELSVIEASAGEGLRRLVDERRVTLLKATPSHLELLVRMLDGEHPLRTLVVGGEAFGTDLADRLLAVQPELEIFNEYGPTEGVVGCMVHRYDPSLDRPPEVPIGRPAPGCSIVVRDPYGHPTPLGASGELHLRRPGMAEGYWRRPDLDQGRFVADGGLQWYRTGDRVRLLDPHTMVYEGRLDEQLKLGAVRVEPGEIEAALNAHPDIEQSVVRVWSPASGDADHPACVRCGLSTEVPGVGIDDDGVCSVCREYDTVAEQAERYFGTPDDLCRIVAQAGAGRAGDYDCLHLLSGGKDSTYALYQLVEMGLRVRALTLDNGFISDGAKANVARAVSDLGVDHEFVTTEAMNEVFRDSLERYSNVCNGCFKVLYTLAVGVADRHDIPVIVTGLSRGQFFETRLTPAQFRRAGFDPAAVDATVLAARKAYHREHDAVAELLDTSVFATDDVFDRIRFVDFYRYTDVELDEMLAFLDERAPWVRPADTGRSTNCLVNAAGIHVHRTERGFHNYALPYSWDVRLGHKTRAEAVDELDDPIVADEVAAMLAEIGYVPHPTEVLTAWYVAPAELDPADLRRRLARVLPAHSIPTAFVRIDAVPLTANGKVAPDRLLAPTRTHRIADGTEPETETERLVSEVWAGILGLDQVGVTTPFFDLGGTSLRALEMIVAVADRLGIDVPERLAFEHRTVRDLAVQLDDLLREGGPTTSEASTTPTAGATPALSVGEEAMLFHARRHPGDVRYNVTRLYDIEGALDAERLEAAVRQVAARHHTLRTSYADDRHEIDAPVWVQRRALARDDELAEWADDLKRRPFDLDAGPLVRLGIVRRSGERWAVLIGVPHIVADAGALDVFWDQVAAVYQGDELAPLPVSYAEVGVRQRRRHEHDPGAARFWAEQLDGRIDARPLAIEGPRRATPDGYVERPLDLTASQLAEGPGRTAFTTALAALAVVLARHGRGARPGIAITASTRDGSDTEPLVGYFLNPLPLGVQVGDEDTFAEVCRSADAAVANSLPHR
ncbi:MAG: amino acid adenylation domain-containing protein, partial [Acidimicrobiia bacterium]|nr:amino acid adenylation domain-containing protein [Acidimicrobiia bacterium]